ncbi:unnamed protein product [Protopolystoma xenopodis]|uniref:Uncharacterized protein n=1 Tax=Protopolystoma xenopodis TaxID=117903 RepID=A0A3S5CGT0_9PLAT|nr:unnamed protein product [Protopolystoma xenopodis]
MAQVPADAGCGVISDPGEHVESCTAPHLPVARRAGKAVWQFGASSVVLPSSSPRGQLTFRQPGGGCVARVPASAAVHGSVNAISRLDSSDPLRRRALLLRQASSDRFFPLHAPSTGRRVGGNGQQCLAEVHNRPERRDQASTAPKPVTCFTERAFREDQRDRLIGDQRLGEARNSSSSGRQVDLFRPSGRVDSRAAVEALVAMTDGVRPVFGYASDTDVLAAKSSLASSFFLSAKTTGLPAASTIRSGWPTWGQSASMTPAGRIESLKYFPKQTSLAGLPSTSGVEGSLLPRLGEQTGQPGSVLRPVTGMRSLRGDGLRASREIAQLLQPVGGQLEKADLKNEPKVMPFRGQTRPGCCPGRVDGLFGEANSASDEPIGTAVIQKDVETIARPSHLATGVHVGENEHPTAIGRHWPTNTSRPWSGETSRESELTEGLLRQLALLRAFRLCRTSRESEKCSKKDDQPIQKGACTKSVVKLG